jgi:putative membrane protein insertion efficiency factor
MMQPALRFILRAYKWLISPLLPPACRFVPTCSEYALEAVERHGAVRGLGKAVWRLLRCHPLAKGGYDPVEHPGSIPTRAKTARVGSPSRLAEEQTMHFDPEPRKIYLKR